MNQSEKDYQRSSAQSILDMLKICPDEAAKGQFLMGFICGVQSREKEAIANFVEQQPHTTPAELARLIRVEKYREK